MAKLIKMGSKKSARSLRDFLIQDFDTNATYHEVVLSSAVDGRTIQMPFNVHNRNETKRVFDAIERIERAGLLKLKFHQLSSRDENESSHSVQEWEHYVLSLTEIESHTFIISEQEKTVFVDELCQVLMINRVNDDARHTVLTMIYENDGCLSIHIFRHLYSVDKLSRKITLNNELSSSVISNIISPIMDSYNLNYQYKKTDFDDSLNKAVFNRKSVSSVTEDTSLVNVQKLLQFDIEEKTSQLSVIRNAMVAVKKEREAQLALSEAKESLLNTNNDLEQTKKELLHTKTELMQIKDEFLNVKDKLVKTKYDLLKSEDAYKHTESSLAEKKSELVGAKSEIVELKNELLNQNNNNENLEWKNSELYDKLAQENSAKDNLYKKNEKLIIEVEAINHQLYSSNTLLSERELTIYEKDKKINVLIEECDQLKLINKSLIEKNKESEKTNAEIYSQLTKITTEKRELYKEKEQLFNDIRLTTSQLEIIKRDLVNREMIIKDSNEKIDSIFVENKMLKRSESDLIAQSMQDKNAIKILNEEKEILNVTIKINNNDLFIYKNKISDYELAININNDKIKNLLGENSQLQNKVGDLTERLVISEQNTRNIELSLQQQQEEAQHQIQQLETLKAQLVEQQDASLTVMQRDLSERELVINSKGDSINRLSIENSQLQNKVSDLTERLVISEQNTCNIELSLQQQQEEAQHQIQQLETLKAQLVEQQDASLTVMQRDLSERNLVINSKDERINALSIENNQLQRKVSDLTQCLSATEHNETPSHNIAVNLQLEPSIKEDISEAVMANTANEAQEKLTIEHSVVCAEPVLPAIIEGIYFNPSSVDLVQQKQSKEEINTNLKTLMNRAKDYGVDLVLLGAIAENKPFKIEKNEQYRRSIIRIDIHHKLVDSTQDKLSILIESEHCSDIKGIAVFNGIGTFISFQGDQSVFYAIKALQDELVIAYLLEDNSRLVDYNKTARLSKPLSLAQNEVIDALSISQSFLKLLGISKNGQLLLKMIINEAGVDVYSHILVGKEGNLFVASTPNSYMMNAKAKEKLKATLIESQEKRKLSEKIKNDFLVK